MMKRLLGSVAGFTLIAGIAMAAWAGPAFDAEGRFIVPARTDRWPTIGVTVAMQYEGDAGGQSFNTVRMDPASYDAYVATGKFPVGAMLELEIRRQSQDVEPARGGSFQGALVTHSIHIKDEKAGPGTWTFYRYSADQKSGTAIERTANCYSCHDEHAKQDTVFTQFYPILAEKVAK